MARPKKIGLDYFPLDVNFYRDVKVRKLMRNNGGGKALAVYTVLLCSIYENGYYMVWDSDSPFMLSEKLGFEEGYLKEVTNYCVSVGLFDRDLFEENGVLTSRSIQDRYFAAKRLRKGVQEMPYVYPEFILQDSADMAADDDEIVFAAKTPVSATKTPQNESYCSNNDVENRVFAAKTPVSATKTQVIAAKSTESKVKYNIPSSPPTARVRESALMETITARDAAEILRQDKEWLLMIQRRFALSAAQTISLLDVFAVECECRGKQDHQDLADAKQHFIDWFMKQQNAQKASGKGRKKASATTAPDKESYRERWMRCHAEICQASPSEDLPMVSQMRFDHFDIPSGKLFVKVPSEDVIRYIEANCISVLGRGLAKYFGAGVGLNYCV